MSHIPAAAMPHAQAHHSTEDKQEGPAAATVSHASTPWIAVAIGGTVAIGGALAAAWLLRRENKPAKRKIKARRPRKATAAKPEKRRGKVSRGVRPAAD